MIKILKLSNRKEAWLFIITTLLITMTAAVDITQPLFFSEIGNQILAIISNDSAADDSVYHVEMAKWIAGMLAVVIVGVFIHLLAINLISRASTSLVRRTRMMIFNKSLNLSTDKVESFGISSLVVRTSSDLLQIRDAIYMLFTLAIRAPLFVILGFILSFTKIDALSAQLGVLNNDQYLLAIAFIVIPLSIPVIWFLIAKAQKNFKAQRTYLDQNNQIMLENLTGGRVIRVFNLEQNQENHFGVVNNSLRSVSKKGETLINILMPIIIFALNIATALIQIVFGVLAMQLSTDSNPKDALVAIGNLQVLTQTFMQFFSLILMGFILFASSLFTIERARPSVKRVTEVLNTKSSINDGKSNRKVESGSIEFRNVNFKYPNDEEDDQGKNVLNNINFKIESGQILGIIGPTGSGKTTLANLISRFHDPTSGEVLIDKENLKNYKLNHVKEAISVAFQDKILFKGTIESNIRVGKMDATEQEVIDAAKNAEAFEFIDTKEKKFQSEVEQGGTNLSGGQKQRVSIARALIKKPKILVFDDSLSALDNITEAKLLNNIKKNLHGITLVIVAQRVKSIQNANQIIVMDEGKIAGIGTHEQLLKSNELYNQIYDSQRTSIGG